MHPSQESHTLRPDFSYHYDNPYADKMQQECREFVLLDKEGESFAGEWNKAVFKHQAPLHVELGSGYGQFLQDLAIRYPELNIIGMDFRFKRSYQLARKLKKRGFTHLKYLRARAERIHFLFGKAEVDQLYLFFPDPWPKTRHHKKRLFQEHFLDNCAKVMRPGGQFFIKTDHSHYFEHMLAVANQSLNQWKINWHSLHLYKERPEHPIASFQTKFVTPHTPSP